MSEKVDGGRLACGCLAGFRVGVAGSRITVFIAQKAPGCQISIHIGGQPVYDHREAVRPATRPLPHHHSDFEEG